MKQNIQKFFSNGGKTKLAYWSVILTLFTLLARVIFGGGSYTTNTYVGELWAYAVTSGDKVVVNEEA